MRNKFLRVMLVLALAFMLTVGVISCAKLGSGVTSQSLDPIPASVIDVNEITWYDAGVAVSTTTYYYGPADNGTVGEIILRWNQAELFATIDIVTGTQTFTVTPQLSADGTNWVDAWFTNPDAWSSSSSSSFTVVTTGTVTSTMVLAGSGSGASATSTVDRNMAFSADGTNALSFPLIGKYMRLKTEVLTTAYTVIPEFYVILKNK